MDRGVKRRPALVTFASRGPHGAFRWGLAVSLLIGAAVLTMACEDVGDSPNGAASTPTLPSTATTQPGRATPTTAPEPTSTPVPATGTIPSNTPTPGRTPEIALGSVVLIELGTTQKDCVDVFLGPSASERPIGCLGEGETGSVTRGPIVVGRETWWLIETKSGAGYIQESFLTPATRQP
jgi:hypothetical protein